MRIVITPYNSQWPALFEKEAALIHEALGTNCIALHHVGSTAVPGLSAKPILNIIAIVKRPQDTIERLEALGFRYKGEYNIPQRYYFDRPGTNLHMYEEGHAEIALNLTFRDYLRSHPAARDAYEQLKTALVQEEASHEKTETGFTRYNLGKDAFIRKTLLAAQFDRVRMLKCMHYAEWDFAKEMRRKTFFAPQKMEDPYTWTFNHSEHAHLILYRGVEMIGYAHVQFWPEKRAALRIIVIDTPYRKHGLGSEFLHLIEKWLKKLGCVSLHDEARPDVVSFYRKNGYSEMPFDDPSGDPPSVHDIAMGKKL